MPCSRIQRRRAQVTSGRACSAARRLFFEGDVVSDEKKRQSAAAPGDPSPTHRRNRFVQRQIWMLGNQRQQPVRVLLQWRDASATGLRCGAAVIAPTPQPVDHRTQAHFKEGGHLMSRRATFDDRYRSRPQVVRIRLSHPSKRNQGSQIRSFTDRESPRFDADGICSSPSCSFGAADFGVGWCAGLKVHICRPGPVAVFSSD